MHEDLLEVVDVHNKLKGQADKAIVGLDDVKEKTEIAFWSEIPTTLAVKKSRRVNAGLVWFMGVPGTGKTYFGLVFAKITNTNFVRIQGRADLTPSDIVGVEIFNPKSGDWEKRPGPIVKAEILLLDEGTRIPPKTQSAFLEANQDRTVTLGDTTIELPEFYFVIMTANPVETGEGTYPMSDANVDRFTFIINVGYLPPNEEQKLVSFDIKSVDIEPCVKWERVVELRSSISKQVSLHPKLEKYIRRLVIASRPHNPEIKNFLHSPSELVEEFVQLGASPRAVMCWGPTSKVRALLAGLRDKVYPEDVQALAENVLGHRINLKQNARNHGIGVNDVIADIIQKVPVP